MIPFGQLHRRINLFLNIIHHTAQVTVGYIGRNHDFPFHILAVDGIRAHGRYHFRHITQRNFAAIIRIHHQIANLLHFITSIILHLHNQVETLPLLVNLRNHLSRQSHIDIFRKLRQRNPELGQHFPFRLNFQLRTLNLLFHIQIRHTGNITDRLFYLITQREHLVQIIPEQLNRDIRLRPGQHSVDTMADRLTDFNIRSRNRPQLLAHLCHQFTARTVFQLKRSLYLRHIHAQCMFIQLGTPRFAGYRLYFRNRHQQLFRTLPHFITLFQ